MVPWKVLVTGKNIPLPGQEVLIPAHMVSRETLLMSLKKECHQGAKAGRRKASSSYSSFRASFKNILRVDPGPKTLRQEDLKSKVTLGSIVRACLKK